MNRCPKGLLVVAVFATLAAAAYALPLGDWIVAWVAWGKQHPVAGPAAYVTFIIVATALFLPGSVAMMIGGFLFGFLPGLAFAAIAVPLGAQAAFEAGRWIARPWVRRKLEGMRRMRAIEVALREEALLIVVLTRLSLIIPFNILNYAFGATSVKATTHLVGTAFGMLPAIALYVYLGTLARDLGQILAGDAAPQSLGFWIFGIGLAFVSIATVVVHRAATKALEKHLIEEEPAA